MNLSIIWIRSALLFVIMAAAISLALPARIHAQEVDAGQVPPTARAMSPIDITGYWVSIVSEDWIWRMTAPKIGDFGQGPNNRGSSIPINDEARRVALAWDPAKDEAEGNQCKWYGAASIMRVPGRLHIAWEDETTLRIDTDAGMQTRLFHFGDLPPRGAQPTWQGDSVAEWVNRLSSFEEGNLYTSQGRGVSARTLFGTGGGSPDGVLKSITSRMRPGYLRKNGVPYSGNAVVTEHFRRFEEPNGDTWLIVTTVVDDPQYLNDLYITSTNFKLEPDGSNWNPTPCSAR